MKLFRAVPLFLFSLYSFLKLSYPKLIAEIELSLIFVLLAIAILTFGFVVKQEPSAQVRKQKIFQVGALMLTSLGVMAYFLYNPIQ